LRIKNERCAFHWDVSTSKTEDEFTLLCKVEQALIRLTPGQTSNALSINELEFQVELDGGIVSLVIADY